MKFVGLKIFIAILEVAVFLIIVPWLILVGWALFGDRPPLTGVQVGISIAALCYVLISALVIGAFVSLLKLLLAIERNTAQIAENTAPARESLPDTQEGKSSWLETVFTPVRPSTPV